MINNYILIVQELNNKEFISEQLEAFDMEQAVYNARNGDDYYLSQLHSATKIKVYEYHTKNAKYINDDIGIKKYCVCTPKEGRNIVKEDIGRVVNSNDEMLKWLVNFHNTTCDQTGKQAVSLDEIKALYQATQTKYSL